MRSPREPEPAPSWPRPMAEEAFYGIAGRFVRLVEPHTEADHLILANFLTYAGVLMGRSRHLSLGGTHHYPTCSWLASDLPLERPQGQRVRASGPHVASAYPTRVKVGEGLIWAIRDPIAAAGKRSEPDPGVDHKRLLVRASEFQGALAVMRREGNTISSVLRCASDGMDLEFRAKNQTGPGHCSTHRPSGEHHKGRTTARHHES